MKVGNLDNVLTTGSERVRDLVRFDARYSSDSLVVAQQCLLESFSSWAITRERADIEDFLVVRLRSDGRGPFPSYGRMPRSVQGDLPALLARVHKQTLGKRNVRTIDGITARCQVVIELTALGLLTSSIVPLSTALLASRREYEQSADNLHSLGVILTRAIDAGMLLGDALASDVKAVSERWTSTLQPKSGTVLEKVVKSVARNSGLTASGLILEMGVNKSNVYRAIDDLESVGAVVEVTGRRKDQVWLAPELVQATKNAVKRAVKSKS